MKDPINRSYERLVEEGKVGIRFKPNGERDLFSSKQRERSFYVGDQTPSVGRAVHFQEASDCLAATVAKVNDDGTLNLSYFTGMGGHRQIQNVSEGEGASKWHWPERV